MMMKNPDTTSRTRFCAPNPTARPTTPAPARIGVGSSPTFFNIIMPAKKMMTYLRTLPISSTSVVIRCRCASSSIRLPAVANAVPISRRSTT